MVPVQVMIPLDVRALCAYPLLNNIFRPLESKQCLGVDLELVTAVSSCARDSQCRSKHPATASENSSQTAFCARVAGADTSTAARARTGHGRCSFARRQIRWFRSIINHGNGVWFTDDPSYSLLLHYGQHVLGIAIDHESPPHRSHVGTSRTTSGADDAELAHARRVVPPEIKRIARSQDLLHPAHFADMPPLSFGIRHTRQSRLQQ